MRDEEDDDDVRETEDPADVEDTPDFDDPSARRRAFRKQSAARDAERNFWGMETRYVRFLLNEFKLGKHEKAISERCKDETGVFRATFHHFCDEFNDFPLRLRLFLPRKPLNEDPRTQLPALMLRFRETSFYEPYVEFYRESLRYQDGRPIGLVVPRRGIPYGLLVHTDEGVPRDIPGARLAYRHPEPDAGEPEPELSYVTPFRIVAQAIYRKGRGWKPAN